MKNTKRKKRLKRIEEHFKNINIKDFEKNLKRCGYGEIEPAKNSGFKLKSID